jgi:hypothetical protein
MSNRIVRTALSVACLLLPMAATAAALIPVEDFARQPQLSMPRLSPNGQYLPLSMADESGDSHALIIYKVDDMSHAVSMLRLPKYEVASNIVWVSNTRLVIEKGKEYGSIDKPMLTGEVIATDLDGTHQDYLYGYQAPFGSRAGTRGTWGSIRGHRIRPRVAEQARSRLLRREEQRRISQPASGISRKEHRCWRTRFALTQV